MGRISKAALLLIPCALIVAVPSAWAYWTVDGVALCTAAGDQLQSQIAADGAGGAIVAWHDNRGGSYDIYAQRTNISGSAQWTANGVALCAATGDQQYPQIASDGAGGTIVAWQDFRGGAWDIYAQRVSASGAVQWAVGGVALCTETGNQFSPAIISDGAGGAIVAWYDARDGNYDIFAQRVNASGAIQWTSGGVALCTAKGTQYLPKAVSDGSGGAIVTWTDHRAETFDIYVQRVNASGAVQWTANGVALCAAVQDQYYGEIVSDGAGGAIVAWYDFRNIDNYDIYARRVDASGAAQWTANGVALCTVEGNQINPTIASDGSGGAIVTWQDYRGTSSDIFAQRISISGVVQWKAQGIALCTAAGDQLSPRIVPDGGGGGIVSWHDSRGGSDDIYAQRAGAKGSPQWAANGVAVCVAAGNQQQPAIAADGSGGATIAWWDSRGGNWDVYAQSVDAAGRVGFQSPSIIGVSDVPGDQGGWVRITIARSRLDDALETVYPIATYNVWQRVDNQVRLSMDRRGAGAAGGLPPGSWELVGSFDGCQQSEYVFRTRTLADSTGSGTPYSVYVVTAHTMTPSVWLRSEPDSGYSVDNLPPEPPTGLAAERSFAPDGLVLSWNSNVERDLLHYAVYRGLSEDFIPQEDALIASPTDASYFDRQWRQECGYCYKVSAIDVHGNEGGCTLLAPEEMTGAETSKTLTGTYLLQNFPNPFNPVTKIEFGLVLPSRVSLRIYDAGGRLVRLLVDETRPAARYEELWNGRDGAERRVASGIYFYRLDAGTFTQTKKMVLLR